MEAPFPRTLPILRRKFDEELSATVAHVEGRVATLFTGALALLNPLAKVVFHHLGIPEARRRSEALFDLHVKAASDVPELGMSGAIDRHLPQILANDDFLARLDRSHPSAAQARDLVAEGFRGRLPFTVRLLADGRGETFEDLVRSALTEAELSEGLALQFAVARRLMDLAEERDGLVRVPRPVLPKVVSVARGTLAWYERRSEEELRRVFGPPGLKAG